MIREEFGRGDRITFAAGCALAVALLHVAGAAPLLTWGVAGAALVALVVVR